MKPASVATIVIYCALCIAGTGCSTTTKNYVRVAPLSQYEREQYNCREISFEIAKVKEAAAAIKKDSKFDGRSVLSFLLDYGIGNTLAHDEAATSVRKRYQQLKALEAEKQCGKTPASNVAPATGTPPASGNTLPGLAPTPTPEKAPATEKKQPPA